MSCTECVKTQVAMHTALPRGQFAVGLKIKKIYFCAQHITNTLTRRENKLFGKNKNSRGLIPD